jgi:O-antigen/teichoic acid export membrane protein
MRGKVRSDTLWSLGSFAFVAVAGVAVNLVVGRFYGPETLGGLNLVLAIYILLSQFCVWGQHYAVLQRLAVAAMDEKADRHTFGDILTPAMIVAMVASLVIIALAAAATPLVALMFGGPGFQTSYLLILPALLFFALNKVLLNALNALNRFQSFAIGQAGRYILLILMLVAWPLLGWPGDTLALAFTLSEMALCLLLWPYVQLHAALVFRPGFRDRLADVRTFGQRGMLSGAMSEINTKVDILILGMFANEQAVGVYSVAALIFEGLGQFPMVLRNLINPKLATFVAARDTDGLRSFSKKIMLVSFGGMTLAGLLAVLLYPFFVDWILVLPDYHQALPALIVLMAGLALAAPYLPFDMILSQGGRPGLQSWQKAIATAANLILNLALAPFFGMFGSAMGTAIAMVLSVVSLRYMVRRHLGASL